MRFLSSPFCASLALFLTLPIWGFFIFLLVYEPISIGLLSSIPALVVLIISLGVGPLFILIVSLKPFFSIITVDENGISRSFLGAFWKLHISWDEMAEVCYYVALLECLVFSKSQKLTMVRRSKWYRVKDTIHIALGKKRYAVIAQYLQQPILGMPEVVKDRLEGSKKK